MSLISIEQQQVSGLEQIIIAYYNLETKSSEKVLNEVSSEQIIEAISKSDALGEVLKVVNVLFNLTAPITIWLKLSKYKNIGTLSYHNMPTNYAISALVAMSYEDMKVVYRDLKKETDPEHKEFCDWVETLPYADKLLIDKKETDYKETIHRIISQKWEFLSCIDDLPGLASSLHFLLDHIKPKDMTMQDYGREVLAIFDDIMISKGEEK